MQLAIATTGAAVGSLFGAPQLGWVAGSLLGQVLFPQSGPTATSEGPRLQDLSVTAATYGESIKIAYGTVRLNGNVLWSSGIREVRTEDNSEVGGKGGGQEVSTVSYAYFASWAVAFAEGPAEAVLRIWFDTKLVYDATDAEGASKRKAGVTFRFYPGDEDQLPDPAIEADVGDDSAPAHRGLCTIVFDDVPLQDYGNRIPNVTAEITFKAAPLYPKKTIVNTWGWSSWSRRTVVPDWDRGLIFATGIDADGDKALGVWDADTLEGLYRRKIADITGINDPDTDTLILGGDGNLYINTRSPSDPTDPDDICQIDANTLTLRTRFWNPAKIDLWEQYWDNGCTFGAFDARGRIQWFLAVNEWMGGLAVYQSGDGTLVQLIAHDTTASALEGPIVAEPPGEGRAVAYRFGASTFGESDLHVVRITCSLGAGVLGGLSWSLGIERVATWSVAGGELPWVIEDVPGPVFRDDDGFYYVGLEESFAYSAEGKHRTALIKWREDTGIAGTLIFPEVSALGLPEGIQWNIAVPDGILLLPDQRSHYGGNYNTVHKIDLARFEVIEVLDSAPFPQEFHQFWTAWYDGHRHRILLVRTGEMSMAWYERGSGAGVTLASVVQDLCRRAGLDETDIDTTGLTDTVHGYVVTRQTSVRSCLEQLAKGFFFDGVESDGLLKFIKRGQPASVAIPQDHLGDRDGEGSFWRETRVQELELPEQFSLTYMDKDRDYQEGTQHARRMQLPVPTMASRGQMATQLPIVFTASEAKGIAQRWLYTTWLERSTYALGLGPRYLRHDPGDVVTVTMEDGTLFTLRLTRVDIGAGFGLEVEALSEDAALYVADAIADGGQGFTGRTVPAIQPARLFVLDIPLLRDTDDLGGIASRCYLTCGPTRAHTAWPGGNVYRSQDLTAWIRRARFSAGARYGWVIGVLGDTPSPFSPDTVNTLTVRMIAGEESLAPVTDGELVNGANAALVGSEIVQFRDVADNGDGTWTLSHLLRGRRGTDVFTGSHGAGETMLLLNPGGIEMDSIDLGLIGVDLGFLALTHGETFLTDRRVVKRLTGRDLKPYAPVEARREDVAGDVHLSWMRRTRLGGGWRDGFGEVPLNEESEAYEVDVLNGLDGAVLRTLSAAAPSLIYAAADIASDFGTPPATLHCRIVQLSAKVGRGFWCVWALEDGLAGAVTGKGEGPA